MTDPIADMLTRIRNAQMSRKASVVIPYSKYKYSLAQLLEKEGWLSKVEKKKKGKFDEISVAIKYLPNKQPKIQLIKRVSKPGNRVYVNKSKLPVVLNNYGVAVLSTPQGLMTNKQARREGLGGEIICEIY